MTQTNKKAAVALSSVIASAVMTIGKLIVGLLTGSMGILSEAAHSLLDWVAAGLTFFAVKVGDKPADDAHPYGHGKIESISALIETGLLFLTSAWIIYEAIHRLISGNIEIEVTWYAFAVIIASIIIDIGRSRALMKVAKETNSQALEADALHFKSDILSSCVVLAGLTLSLLGVQGSDSFAAIGVSFFVLHAGWQLGRRTVDTLIDTAPTGIAETARRIILKTPGVINTGRIRARAFGASTFIDAEVTFDRKLSLTKTDDIAQNIREQIGSELLGADITIHPKSGQVANESLAETVAVIAAAKDLTVHDITADTLEGKQYLNYHLDVPAKISVSAAHEIAENLEQAIKAEIGYSAEIYSHIEPIDQSDAKSKKLSVAKRQALIKQINNIAKEVSPCLEPHNVTPRTIEGQLFITMHCLADGNMKIEAANLLIAQLEFLIKSKVPAVHRVVIHIEPK